MEFAEAKAALRKGYTDAGVEVVGETDDTLTVKFAEPIPISREEIEQFGANRDLLVDGAAAPTECSLCTPNLREHLARPVDAAAGRFLMPFGSRHYIFRRLGSERPEVRVGPASDLFVDFFRFDTSYLELCRRRLRRTGFGLRRTGSVTLRELLYRPATVQVSGLEENTVTAAVATSTDLINAAIFAMSYVKSIPYRLLDQWPREEPRSRPRPFTTVERRPGFELELPLVRYDDDLLRFYQLGISTEIPELQYLAFYQVLEYFFVSVADDALYAKLRARLANPSFRLVPRHLDQVIQDVLGHAKTTDETEMLKLVIEKYVDEQQLVAFINRYEEHVGERWYTKKRERFGVEGEVKVQPGHVVGNVAKVVKVVRNALVHSSDRFERVGRHIPFSQSSELVQREVPLLKFLAERVIMASAEPAG
jgi:hypothetical protein